MLPRRTWRCTASGSRSRSGPTGWTSTGRGTRPCGPTCSTRCGGAAGTNNPRFLPRAGPLFGYVETPDGWDAARAAMATEPVNDRWQAEMAPFFEGDGWPADTMMAEL